MSKLHQQLKARRLALGLTQEDMFMRIGMSRQQYHRLESRGNPRLDTLELVAAGLEMELLLVPKEKLLAIKKVLQDAVPEDEDPWSGLLEEEE